MLYDIFYMRRHFKGIILKRFYFGILLMFGLLNPFPAFSQNAASPDEIRKAMEKGDYAAANTLMKDYLQAHLQDPDAWTLHANLIMNEYRSKKPTLSVYQEADEDIYNRSGSETSNPPFELPRLIADSMVRTLLKAAELDPTRIDIHHGICDILSKSGNGKFLVQYLPVLNASMIPASNNPYLLAEYARNLIDRKRFDDGMQAYAAIAGLYPNNAGILSDMAGEYYQSGNLKAALLYAKMSMEKPDIDESTLGNSFFIAAIAEDHIMALDALQKQCALKKTKEYLVFEALLDYEKGLNGLKKVEEYLKSPNKETSLQRLSMLLSANKNSKATLVDFDSMMHFDLPDAYKMVICRWFSTQYPMAFAPSYHYGEMHTFHKDFKKAVSIFDHTNTQNCDSAGWLLYHFHAGYAQYKLSNFEKASYHFIYALQSTDFYEYAAAAYFLGVIHRNKGDLSQAQMFFRLAAPHKAENKFALYCSWLIDG